MKKIAFLAIILIIPSLLLGCGMVGISTNIPILTSGTTVGIINLSGHNLSLEVITDKVREVTFRDPNGQPTKFLAPGQSTSVRFSNWSTNYSVKAVVTAKAWDVHEECDHDGPHPSELVGAVSLIVNLEHQNQGAYPWQVTTEEIRRGGTRTLGGLGGWGW
ncbi:MAG: hypothetical protein HYT03_00360 [Candidatus Harrisonbacteria bacterium]|nr:hypothetical protein [Candidatus Harrisonbacteria bacterium]